MKLPEEYNLYEYNKYTDEILEGVHTLACAGWDDRWDVFKVCENNLKQLKSIQAKIIHLELVLDEIIKLREKQ